MNVSTVTDLYSFCSKDKPSTMQPWNDGDYTYASDMRLVIRVPSLAEGQCRPDAPKNAAKLFLAGNKANWQALLPLPEPETTPCKYCNGKGKQFKACPDCGGSGKRHCDSCGNEHADCRLCAGTGESSEYKDATCLNCNGAGTLPTLQIVCIGEQPVNVELLRMIHSLPGLEICNSLSDLEPLHFRFDGGEGLLMPVKS